MHISFKNINKILYKFKSILLASINKKKHALNPELYAQNIKRWMVG